MRDIKLGLKIRELRTSKKITLQKLSELTKLTTSFLSQLERGVVSPSIDSLRGIARALDVSIGEFFKEELKDFNFVRKDKALKAVDSETKSSYETLVSELLGVKMEPILVHLEKDGQVKKQLLLEGGELFLIVMEGAVELKLDNETIVLEKGDSLYSKGRKKPNQVRNFGNKDAAFLWLRAK